MNQPLQWALPKPGWGPRLLRQELHSPEVLLGQSETWTGARSKFAKLPISWVGKIWDMGGLSHMLHVWYIYLQNWVILDKDKCWDSYSSTIVRIWLWLLPFFGDDIEHARIMDCIGTWWDPHSQNLPMRIGGFLWEWGSYQPWGAHKFHDLL